MANATGDLKSMPRSLTIPKILGPFKSMQNLLRLYKSLGDGTFFFNQHDFLNILSPLIKPKAQKKNDCFQNITAYRQCTWPLKRSDGDIQKD